MIPYAVNEISKKLFLKSSNYSENKILPRLISFRRRCLAMDEFSKSDI